MDTFINILAEQYASKFSEQEDALLKEVSEYTMQNHPLAHMLSGQVLEEKISGKNAVAIHAFNSHVKNDERVELVMLTVRDGLLIVTKLTIKREKLVLLPFFTLPYSI